MRNTKTALTAAQTKAILDFVRNVAGMDRAHIQTCADLNYLRSLLVEFQDEARLILRAMEEDA